MQQTQLAEMAQRGQALAMISCTHCQHTLPINPTTLSAPAPQSQLAINCPMCTVGLVSFVQDNKHAFWGCGSCGNTWPTKEAVTA
jgi:hypothetical protein